MVRGLVFSVLGPIRAVGGDGPVDLGHPQQKAVLAALLLRDGAQITVDQLVDDVWGSAPPRSAVSSLRNYIYRLRQLLDDGRTDLIKSIGTGYGLTAEPGTIDLTVFTRHVAEARRLTEAGDIAAAEARYDEALALWSGVALADVPGPFAHAQRSALAELRLAVVEDLFACRVRLGRGAQAASELALLQSENPLRERLHELRMLALYGAGRRAEALEVYARARRLLTAELGVEPGPALQQVHQMILTADAALDVLVAPQSPAAAPAHAAPAVPAAPRDRTDGRARLVPAQLPADLHRFTGRKQEVDSLLELAPLARKAAAVGLVHGMAGVGKTALAVHAAHLVAPTFPDGQLYVDLRGFDPAGSAAAPADVLAEFLDALGVAATQIPATIAGRSALFRSVLASRRVLVLLDNARDAGQVRPLLPGAPGCLTFVTSRNPMPGLAVSHQARMLPLGLLGEGEAREILAAALGGGRLDREPQAVQDILDHCGGLPLALAIVAARLLLDPADPLETAAGALRAAHGRLDAFALDADPSVNARTVFSWSYRALTAESARLYRLLALHPGPDFTITAAASLAGTAPHQARLLCDELVAANMLVRRGAERFACTICCVRTPANCCSNARTGSSGRRRSSG